MPGSHGKTTLPTGSIISVRALRDLVNKKKRTESQLQFRNTESGVNGVLCSNEVYYHRIRLSINSVDNVFGTDVINKIKKISPLWI